MKKIIGLIFFILSIVSFAEKAPDFNLKDQYNKTHNLTEYKGKIIFLNFWINNCSPCKEELPIIEDLYEEYGKNEKNVIILGVNKENPNEVKEFLEKNGYKFPTLLDKDMELVKKYSVKAVPTCFIIKDGEIVDSNLGILTKEEIKDKISKVTTN